MTLNINYVLTSVFLECVWRQNEWNLSKRDVLVPFESLFGPYLKSLSRFEDLTKDFKVIFEDLPEVSFFLCDLKHFHNKQTKFIDWLLLQSKIKFVIQLSKCRLNFDRTHIKSILCYKTLQICMMQKKVNVTKR